MPAVRRHRMAGVRGTAVCWRERPVSVRREVVGVFCVARVAVDVFPVFEATLAWTAVDAEQSLWCFLEGGGETSAGLGASSSGRSSRARLWDRLGMVIVDSIVRKELALNQR
jgi:hypothetical protein